MVSQTLSVRSRIFVATFAASIISGPPAVAGSSYPAHTPVSEVTRPPIGWVEFCVEYYPECETKPSVPRDILLTTQAWKELARINLWVNSHIKPMTDMDHWGVVERWNYPDDGYGEMEYESIADPNGCLLPADRLTPARCGRVAQFESRVARRGERGAPIEIPENKNASVSYRCVPKTQARSIALSVRCHRMRVVVLGIMLA